MNSVPHSGPSTPAPAGFSEYLAVLKKRRFLLLSIAIPIAVLALLLAIGLPEVYRSSGLIQIEDAQSLQNLEQRDPRNQPYADEYVQSLSTVVLSEPSLRRLLAKHELYDDQAEDPEAALKQLRADISVKMVTVTILDPHTGREREIVTAFTVAYDNRDPQRAKQGAAWLVDAFIAENRRDRQRDAGNAAKFFAAEAERMRAHVSQLESRLAEFKDKHADTLPELTGVNLNVMDRTERDIQEIETQMQALRRERVFLVAQLQQARSASPDTASLRQLEEEYRRKSITYDESHPDLITLRRQIDQLRSGSGAASMSLRGQLQQQRAILSEARQRYSEDHPDVKRIMRNIQALEARIAAGEPDVAPGLDSPMAMQLQTQINATDTQLAALQARSLELRTKLSQLEGRLSAAPQVEREFQEVSRDLASARAKYEELLQRQMDSEVSEAAIASGTADKFRVTTAPSVPNKPAKPNRIVIVLAGLILATIAALSAAFAAQLFDPTVRGLRDLRDALDVTPLAAVPVIENAASAQARRRHLAAFTTKTAIGIAVIYYIASRLIV